jgi:tetratricopeptide (TPR) repeat protein
LRRRAPVAGAALRHAALLGALLLSACASRVGPPSNTPARPVAQPSQALSATAQHPPSKGDPEARFQAAVQLVKDKKPQEAKDAFASLAQDFPQFAGPLDNLGVLQEQGRQHNEALASFAKATSINPSSDFAWAWLGILYRESNDYGHAEQAYRKAISLNPQRAITHLNLGILYDAYLHRPQDALAQYREYQRLAGAGAKPVVVAWINELQDGMAPAAGAASPSPGSPAVVTGSPSAVEGKQ